MESSVDLTPLTDFISQVPSVLPTITSEADEEGRWFIKFQIDIHHFLAWRVVQELSNVVNLLSNDERLPTIFYPVSPPPYLNGGPEENLSWVIQCGDPNFAPAELVDWLDQRMPSPVDDDSVWNIEDEEEE